MRTPSLILKPFLVLFVLAGGIGWFACGSDPVVGPTDTTQPEDIGVITLPDSGNGPHCIDAIPIIDVRPKDISTQCTEDEDCEEALAPIPTCHQPKCLDNRCELVPDADGTPCDDSNPCTQNETCLDGQCKGGESVCECPNGMVSVRDTFCVDQYEASRLDATATNQGTDTTYATSRAGVMPWFPVEYAEANQACRAAGKRLCTVDEIQVACAGPAETIYPYGDEYSPSICNGLDTFCNCDSPACGALAECPYPHCYNHGPDGTAGEGCGAALHLVPTGTFTGCVNAYGAFDLSGNLWELVDRGDGASWYVGGAYNCLNSELLHRCDGIQQNVSAKGFRCCVDYSAGN